MARNPQPNPWRFAHMGMEFAGAALVLALVGYYIDSRIGSRPWGAVIGATAGFTGGMYLFIKEALRANRMYNSDTVKTENEQQDKQQEDD
jgi:F0F1-type ATP synthase assembly protein I